MEIKIRPITLHDKDQFPDCLELLNRTQGRGLFSPDYMDHHVQNPKSYVVGAFLDEKVVGLGVVQIIDNYDFYLPFDPNINVRFKNKKVGSFSTLCVLENLQGKGIGQRISHARLEWALKQHCDVLVGVSWVSGLDHTSDRVFNKMDFVPVKKVEHFFADLSEKRPFDCPGCHKIPCTCSGILYIKEMSQNENF